MRKRPAFTDRRRLQGPGCDQAPPPGLRQAWERTLPSKKLPVKTVNCSASLTFPLRGSRSTSPPTAAAEVFMFKSPRHTPKALGHVHRDRRHAPHLGAPPPAAPRGPRASSELGACAPARAGAGRTGPAEGAGRGRTSAASRGWVTGKS